MLMVLPGIGLPIAGAAYAQATPPAPNQGQGAQGQGAQGQGAQGQGAQGQGTQAAPPAGARNGNGRPAGGDSSVLDVGATEAVPGRGFYVRGSVGAVSLPDMNLTDTAFRTNIGFEPGYALTLAGGFKFNRILGIEAEIGHRSLSSSDVHVGATAQSGISTSFNAQTLLVNLVAELGKTEIRPFIGVGLGMARIQLEDFKTTSGSYFGEPTNEFAYQLMAGVGYALSDSTMISVDYRWLATDSPTGTNTRGVEINVDAPRLHSFSIGIRQMF